MSYSFGRKDWEGGVELWQLLYHYGCPGCSVGVSCIIYNTSCNTKDDVMFLAYMERFASTLQHYCVSGFG